VAALVEARDVFAVYPSAAGGVAALQGLSLDVEEREICVVLGPSGSGKTTLMRVLAGLERPSAGSVVVAGLDLARARRRDLEQFRSRVLGYADQHYWRALAGELTVRELVALPLGLQGAAQPEATRRASELLERVGLHDREAARPGELSGGEQQRVALCAAVSHRPRLLIADEPTGELDAQASAEICALLAELAAETGATAIVVSHDPATTGIADRVAHIRDGRLAEERHRELETTVIGAGGWLRIPEEALRAAGIGDRALIVPGRDVVELRPVDGRPARATPARARVPGSRGVQVEASGVSRRYGEQVALHELSATFPPGELSVVTGPSGSGKSTLLALLAGLDVPDEGRVLVDGVVVSSLDRDERAQLRAERIGVLGQLPGLSDSLSARENVELGLLLRGVSAGDAQGRAGEALDAVGLAAHADRRAGLLSAGQRERVALARVLASRPAVVIADEPTARLDAVTTLEIGRLLAELAHGTGTTVVCATHDQLLIGLADREVRLRESARERARASV
jgi:ABC-type lipoprotein export system ATPase subunit